MVKQFRIEHLQGVEVLVCEFYAKHTWNPQEVEAFSRFFEHYRPALQVTREDFRLELEEWFNGEHQEGETFYGLSQPILVYEISPHMLIRGAIVDNKVASFSCDHAVSVSQREVLDGVEAFFAFVRSPHWRNAVSLSINDHGTLFGSDND